jgi:hypothetical protein
LKVPQPSLEKVVFELRYEHGHRYLDRCGETLLQIESRLPQEWIPQEINPSQGSLINPAKDIVFNFNSYKLDASQDHPKDLKDFTAQVSALADVVCTNLDLNTFIRIGIRFYYFYPAESIERAEAMVRAANFGTLGPKLSSLFGSEATAQKHIFIFEDGRMGRRIEIGAVRRETGKVPASLLAVEPRLLPRGQRQALAQRLVDARMYSQDPKFAMQIDSDNYELEPESFSVGSFIERNHLFVTDQLLELVRKR